MKNIGKYSFTFLLVVAGAFIAVWAYSRFFDKPQIVTVTETQHLKYAGLGDEGGFPDLTFAAEKSVHAVVHIATQSVRGGGWTTGHPFFDEFFGLRGQPQQLAQGFGSGVIISASRNSVLMPQTVTKSPALRQVWHGHPLAAACCLSKQRGHPAQAD